MLIRENNDNGLQVTTRDTHYAQDLFIVGVQSEEAGHCEDTPVCYIKDCVNRRYLTDIPIQELPGIRDAINALLEYYGYQ